MKSYNTSFPQFRRALIAAAVVLATGTASIVAQSSQQTTPATPNSGSNYENNQNSTNTSANQSTNDTDMSSNRNTSTDQSSNQNTTNASAETNNTSNTSSNSGEKLSWSDKHFITKAAEGNQKEIQLAQLATDHASSPDVRQFAQQLVQDHTKLGNDLQTLAQNNNVTLKSETREDHEYKKLSKAQGSDFDRQFVKRMVAEHKKDIKEFSDRVDDSKNADLKSFAQNQLPTLQHHLQLAQQLEQSIVPTGRSGKESWKQSSGSSSTNASSSSTDSAAAQTHDTAAPTTGSNAGMSTPSSTSSPSTK